MLEELVQTLLHDLDYMAFIPTSTYGRMAMTFPKSFGQSLLRKTYNCTWIFFLSIKNKNLPPF